MDIEKRTPLLMRCLEGGFAQALMERGRALDGQLRNYVDRLLVSPSGRRETDAGRLQKWISFFGLDKLRGALALPSTLGAPDYLLFKRVLAEAQKTVKGLGGRLIPRLPDRAEKTRPSNTSMSGWKRSSPPLPSRLSILGALSGRTGTLYPCFPFAAVGITTLRDTGWSPR